MSNTCSRSRDLDAPTIRRDSPRVSRAEPLAFTRAIRHFPNSSCLSPPGFADHRPRCVSSKPLSCTTCWDRSPARVISLTLIGNVSVRLVWGSSDSIDCNFVWSTEAAAYHFYSKPPSYHANTVLASQGPLGWLSDFHFGESFSKFGVNPICDFVSSSKSPRWNLGFQVQTRFANTSRAPKCGEGILESLTSPVTSRVRGNLFTSWSLPWGLGPCWPRLGGNSQAPRLLKWPGLGNAWCFCNQHSCQVSETLTE